MSKKTRRSLPFDLPPKTFLYLLLPKPILAGMYDSDSEGERNALDLMIPLLDMETDPEEPRIAIPRRYGWTGPERVRMQAATDTSAETQLRALTLFREISKETGISFEDVARTADNTQALFNDERYEPFIDRVVTLQNSFKASSLEDVEATQLMIRVIPEWKVQNTQDLTGFIVSQLYEMAVIESSGYHSEDSEDSEGKDPSPLTELSPT